MSERVSSAAERALDPALRSQLEAALAAIDADSANYGDTLATLLDASAQLAQCVHEALVSELFAELRKLRPTALWVRDRAPLALALKRALHLDGALCSLDAQAPFPAAQGRECWLELPADSEEARLRALPSGFGLVLNGPHHDLTLAAIRRALPLRALGVVCQSAAALPEARLDLALFEEGGPCPVRGARVLCTGIEPEAVREEHLEQGLGGIVCDASHALAWALRLAVQRPMRERGRL
jgi:hypothetical protein